MILEKINIWLRKSIIVKLFYLLFMNFFVVSLSLSFILNDILYENNLYFLNSGVIWVGVDGIGVDVWGIIIYYDVKNIIEDRFEESIFLGSFFLFEVD